MNYDELVDYASLMTDRRDRWRDKAEIAQAQNEALQNQLAYWQEIAQNRKQRNDELAQLMKVREVNGFARGFNKAFEWVASAKGYQVGEKRFPDNRAHGDDEWPYRHFTDGIDLAIEIAVQITEGTSK